MSAHALSCPVCGRRHPRELRFCVDCGMPLVADRDELPEPSAARRQARKIKPQYAVGAPVKVARATNLAEAEFLAGLLLEEGIPSFLNSAIAGHGPLAGARDILVPESGAEAAREALSPLADDG